jgi:hypothetical protein
LSDDLDAKTANVVGDMGALNQEQLKSCRVDGERAPVYSVADDASHVLGHHGKCDVCIKMSFHQFLRKNLGANPKGGMVVVEKIQDAVSELYWKHSTGRVCQDSTRLCWR